MTEPSTTNNTATESTKPTPESARHLMQLSMPAFEKFLAHGAALKNECEKAGELTPERAAKFDTWRDALIGAREEYEAEIEKLICDEMPAEMVDLLVTFFSGSPTFKALEKSQSLAGKVNEIGVNWTTRVLERCPDTWRMLMDDVRRWQDKNTPEGATNIIPETPGSEDGWTRIGPKTAEELPDPPAAA